MPVENHSKQIKGLSFMPVGGFPQRCDGGDMRVVLTQQNFQSKSVVMLCREQVVVNLESRSFLGPAIAAAEIGEHIEAMFVLQKRARFDNRFARNENRDLSMAFRYICDPACVLRSKFFDKFLKHKIYKFTAETPQTQREEIKKLLNLCVSASRR